MKQYILKMAAAAAGITFLASCVDDNYTEFDKGSDTLLLKAGTEEVLMEEVNYSSDAISLEWSTGHNFGTGNKIFYTLEIDKAGNDFADPYVAVNAENAPCSIDARGEYKAVDFLTGETSDIHGRVELPPYGVKYLKLV